MVTLLEANRAFAALQVGPAWFFQKFGSRVLAGGHSLAHGFVVIADFLEAGG